MSWKLKLKFVFVVESKMSEVEEEDSVKQALVSYQLLRFWVIGSCSLIILKAQDTSIGPEGSMLNCRFYLMFIVFIVFNVISSLDSNISCTDHKQ